MVKAFTLNTVVPMWLGGFFIRHCPGSRLYIVNISSGAANRPVAGWSTYCSSKAALKMAGQVTAQDLEHYNHYGKQSGAVSIISYSPGTVATAMQAEIRGHTPESFPRVPYFLSLHETGELKTADLPAAEIAALLENEDLPAYNEVDYGA
jgi:benzil reductase ((S)-benzoin forming)